MTILRANNIAMQHGGYSLSKEHRRPIDQVVGRLDQLMILASQNDLVAALRAFWMRKIPIWEGHTRDALAGLVAVLRDKNGVAEDLAQGLIEFVSGVSIGFTQKSHGDRLLQEIREGCIRKTKGKPANIQALARLLLENPSTRGVSDAVAMIRDLIEAGGDGFSDVKIDHRVEFRDAIRLGVFSDAEEGFAEIARRRSYSRSSPPPRTLSSIHKAKGLECDHVMVMACDRTQFSSTSYAKSKMYVAISRAKRSLALVVPDTNTSPLFKI